MHHVYPSCHTNIACNQYFFFSFGHHFVIIITDKHAVVTGADQVDFTLPRMVPNDNYANPQETMYDSILTLKGLQTPPHITNHHSPTTPSTPGSDPNAPLLPPRNTAATVAESQMPLRVRRNLQPLTLKEDNGREDEYIQMTANPVARVAPSPRYTEPPTLSFSAQSQQQETVYSIPGPSSSTKT